MKQLCLMAAAIFVAAISSFSQVSVDAVEEYRLSGIASNDPAMAYSATIPHATLTTYETENINIPHIKDRSGIEILNWVSLQITTATLESGAITGASYEILCSPRIGSTSDVVPNVLKRANGADTGVWMPIPAIESLGIFVFPVFGNDFKIRANSGNAGAGVPDSVTRFLDLEFTKPPE